MTRTHTCGELTTKSLEKKVELNGWVNSRRDHGGVIFIDLRDRYGLTQIVFEPKNKKLFDEGNKLRREFVVKVVGKVRSRPRGMENPNLKTGKIEVLVSELEIFNKSEVPPFEIDDRVEANEEMRLKYKYLDLRRPLMQQRLLIRHNAAQAAREFLSKNNFLEIETPMLVKSTPEGARDYIVPSRVNPGKFYALPQSPQLYKQILMVSGCDRYFQLARCLRDEDLRTDRQPEFTQIDVEMSFVEQEDIFKIGEGLIKYIFKKTLNLIVKTPFPRLTYNEAMDKYGCDKPDLRFGLELIDVSKIVKKSNFQVFKNSAVKCINPKKDFSRNELDDYIKFCQDNGAKGMVWMRVTKEGLDSNIAKYFDANLQKELINFVKAKHGSILMFIAGNEKHVNEIMSKLRNKLGKNLKLYKPEEFKFCWVFDFPLFEWKEEDNCWGAAHHMFTMPKKEHLKFLESNPEKVLANCYDLVLNGVEIASGSLRIWDTEIQKRVMKVIGFPEEKAIERFGFLLEAFKFGCPPHGGFAIGFDRLVAMMSGINDIREVIAFPKTKDAECLMSGCPSSVSEKQLKELHLKVDLIKK